MTRDELAENYAMHVVIWTGLFRFSRVAQNEDFLEKLTSLGGLGFVLGPIG